MGCVVKWDAQTAAAVQEVAAVEGGCVLQWMALPEAAKSSAAAVKKGGAQAVSPDGCLVQWKDAVGATAAPTEASGCIVQWKEADLAKVQAHLAANPEGCFINWAALTADQLKAKMVADGCIVKW
jgi:hypothetical protein